MADRKLLADNQTDGHGSLDDDLAVRSPSANRAVNADDDDEPVRDSCPQCYNARIDRFFKITERKSTVWTEIRAGLTTFVTMAYILLVNPQVLSKSGMPFAPLVTATALSAAIASLLVGLLGNLPFGMAAGMGLNSYFTFGVVLKKGLSWQIGLTSVFFQGVLFMILSLTGLCAWIQLYAPPCIKKSITVGLGLFQALVGLEQMALVVRPKEEGVLLGLGDLSDPAIWVALIGIMIISVLMVLEVRASMLIGILVTTFTMWIGKFGADTHWPDNVVRVPDFSHTFFSADFGGYFSHWQDTIPVTLVFLFVSIFDTAGVQYAAGQQAGLLDENHRLPAANQAFFSAGLATSLGAFFGTSPVIIHNETCAGIHDGGRTGLTAVTVGLAFLITMPFAPIFEAVPLEASAPPLVVVGALMMACAKFIDWEQFDEALPAFMVVTVLPFTYSIANGFFFGLGAYVCVKGGTWLFAKIARREANVMPVTVKEEVGIPDPSPGLPAPPMVYHSQSYYNKIMSASQAQLGRSQRIVTGGTLTGSNSSHYIAAGDIEGGERRVPQVGGGLAGGVNGVPSDDALRAMNASERRLALSRSVNQLRTGSFARGSFAGSRSGPSHASDAPRFR